MAGHDGTLAGSVVALFALVQWRGIRVGNLVQQVTSLLKGVALAAVAAAAFVLVDGTVAASVDVTADSGRTGILAAAAFVVALQSAIFTYDGWTAPIYFGQELSDPARDIQRAMIWGVLLVLAIYLALNAAFITVVPLNEMAGDPFVAATVMRRLFGLQGEAVLRVVMLVSLLASVNALMLMASRVPFAMSEDRLLPPVAGRVNAGGTPVAGLLLSTGITQAFIATNAFNTVLAMLAFLFVASYVVTFAALFVSRRREPQAPRPFRVPWYPLVPGVALGGSVAFLGAALVSDPRHSLMAVALVALSWPLYRVQRVGHPIPQKEHA